MEFSQTYFEKEMKVNHNGEDSIYSDHYNAEALHAILDTQLQITEFTKKRNLMKKTNIN